jgi:4-hydroxy 2-oxovalerate aldolase
MLSGFFDCHPTYSKKLINLREYTIEDIWRALNLIKKKDPVGFSQELLSEVINMGITEDSIEQPDIEDKKVVSSSESHTGRLDVTYSGRHQGKTFLVLANGPNLKNYSAQIKAFIDKHNPIVLGANYLGDIVVPQYHAFSNKRRFESYIKSVSDVSRLLISQHIHEDMMRDYTDRDYETLYYIDTLNNNFDIVDGVIQCNCRTISVLLLGVAIVMGADRIFAAGMDGYILDSNNEVLFYDEKESKHDKGLIMEMHRWNSKFIEQINDHFINLGKEGIHILTPTSYGKFYKGINNYI